MSDAIDLHRKYKGKLEIKSKVPLKDKDDLSLAYTPGVAEVSLAIAEDKTLAYELTSKWNMVAVVSDGTAVLGLGDIGPVAALPVMEGKAVLFKEFGGVDAIPICLDTKDTEEIIKTVKYLEPSFGGINLEDISAPRCFEIEERLKKELNIPVFHDDQHGTAIVVLAGLINALKIVKKDVSAIKVVVNGAGAAGIAISRLLLSYGVKDLLLVDSKGIVSKGRDGTNRYKLEVVEKSDYHKEGSLSDALIGADVFIGVSKGNIVTEKMVRSMAERSIIFAMANPTPEIFPEKAHAAGAAVVATGRSDYPNQINNVLVFPGIFRGVLDARVKQITEKMKLAAAKALASLVEKPTAEKIIPGPFEKGVADAIADAVKSCVR
ncbi:NAD-dependent malic enzyme [Candidatus Woesearchaeota archaeon CG10_big_fil_rev_8_21_14_0_10_45_16]|nr:MAG: NAD-dependent malic enzyme [Candidatus Woesearchaeota archaeon CG10_big_fil_rev_8_21_14_0_10_45_16]